MRLVRLAMAAALVMALGTVAMADPIAPDRLEYQGAFKLSGTWAYGGYGAAYYGPGNPAPLAGELTGSLKVYGHAWYHNIGEVAIPTTLGKKSEGATLATLTTARTIQTPAPSGTAQPGAGGALEYLAGMDKLCYGTNTSGGAGHGFSDPDGTNPQGLWSLAGQDQRRLGGAISEIAPAWAAANLPAGQALITGFEWESYGAGPTIVAYDPSDPAPGTTLPSTRLLAYSGTNPMTDWDRDDTWGGSAWLEAGADSAVVLLGRKDVTNMGGDSGAADDLHAWILFYDPADLAAVVAGGNTYDPQPYATLDVSAEMFSVQELEAAAYDRERSLLFGIENNNGNETIHVWLVTEPALPIPEPAGLGLMGLALLALRRRRG